MFEIQKITESHSDARVYMVWGYENNKLSNLNNWQIFLTGMFFKAWGKGSIIIKIKRNLKVRIIFCEIKCFG